MACGTPLVAFANQGYKDVLTGKFSERFLARNKDCDDLTKKIEALIEDPLLRKDASEEGLKEVQEYSWKKIVDKILNFYKKCEEKKN